MTTTAAPTTTITSRPAAAAHLTRVCFKLGPPRLVGAELEWFTRTTDPHDPSGRPDVPRLAAALGDHAPRTISPDSPVHPLTSGSIVSVEPGGQIELSSIPADSVDELCAALAADERELRGLLAAGGIRVVAGAGDATRAPLRILTSDRYRSMEAAFARRGIFGSLMMCNTAAVQVALDAGVDADHAVTRWTRLHTIGPAITAAFACSPRLHGADDERWASQRMRAWLGTDRTRIPPHAQSIDDYADWVLSVPLLCVRCADGSWYSPPPEATFADWMDGRLDDEVGRRPDADDLAYHVTTVFPMVRPQGYLEVRYIDGQPEDLWRVPIAAVAALMSDDTVGAEADTIAGPTADAWMRGAQCGLSDPELRSTAARLLTLAADVAPTGVDRDLLAAAAARCARGEPPMTADRQDIVAR
jgi:glutamate--cysteine ligase